MALKAGRVGVRPDQVDRYGRIKSADIVKEVIASIVKNVPFLEYEWHSIRYICDGHGNYEIISDISGITIDKPTSLGTNPKGILLPENYDVVGYFWGFSSMITSADVNVTFNNGGFYLQSETGAPCIYVNDYTKPQDTTVWVALKPRTNDRSVELSKTINESSKKGTKKIEE